MALGDLVWLQHVPVLGKWSPEEREDVISSVLFHDCGVYFFPCSFPNLIDSPRTVDPRRALKIVELKAEVFLSSRDVSCVVTKGCG